EEVIGAGAEGLRHEVQVPVFSLVLFRESPLSVGRSVRQAEGQHSIRGLLAGGKTICGALRPHQLAFLFSYEASKEIGSAAVVALNNQQGILAIGSRDPQHYKSSLGTLFLGYNAEILTRVLPRFSTPLRSVR